MSGPLSGINGGFVLSIDDVTDIREMFSLARNEAAKTTYAIGPRVRAVSNGLN